MLQPSVLVKEQDDSTNNIKLTARDRIGRAASAGISLFRHVIEIYEKRWPFSVAPHVSFIFRFRIRRDLKGN